MRASLEKNPEIARAYDLYVQCKGSSIITVEASKGGKPITKILPYTTGISVLPYEGGLLDQPYRLMEFFDAFVSGEQAAFFDNLNKP